MIEIISLNPSQWRDYKTLRLEALQSDAHAFCTTDDMFQKPDSYWQERLTTAQKAETNWLLFASDQGKLVGMVGAYQKDQLDAAEIISLYVNKSYRGQGISKLLLSGIIEAVKKNPHIKKAIIEVKTTQIPAINLYRSFGFETIKENTACDLKTKSLVIEKILA